MEQLKVGDVVELKSGQVLGSPKMIIEAIDSTLAWCIWFVNSEVRRDKFLLACLQTT